MVLFVSPVEAKVAGLIRFLANEWGYEIPDAIGPIADAEHEPRADDPPASRETQAELRSAERLLALQDRFQSAGYRSGPDTLLAISSRAKALWTLGRKDEAVTQLQKQRDLLVGIHGVDSPDTMWAGVLLAVALGETEGWSGRATEMLEDEVDHQRRVLGPEHRDSQRVSAILNLATTGFPPEGEHGDLVSELMAERSVMAVSMSPLRDSVSDASADSAAADQAK